MKSYAVMIRIMVVAGFIALPAGAVAQNNVTLTVADLYPTKHIVSLEGATYWMKRATELSGGKIEFKYFPSEQMAKANGLLQAIRTGVVDSGSVCVAYVSDKMPLNGVTVLPGLTRSAREGSSAYWRALQSGLLRDEFIANEVVPMFVYMFPAYQIVSTREELRKVNDFKGLKLRTAGSSMNLMVQSLGGTPIAMATPDMYLAMERKTVDGTFLALLSITSYNLQDIAKSVSLNGSFGNSPCIYAINAKRFAALPQDVRDALLKAGEDTVKHLADALDDGNRQASVELSKAGVNLYNFTDGELASINKALAPVAGDWFKRMETRKLPAHEVLKEFMAAVAAGH